jgi:hypothetical protein
MTVTNPAPAGSSSLIARVQGILMTPAAEWDKIEVESATIPGLFTGYACILAAIPAVALILQHLLFIHWGLLWVIVIAVLTYVASLVGVFIMGFIIDALAPTFGAQKNSVQAMKLAVYPYTALWIAGILNIVPILGILATLAGLYGLYILYLGLPKLMKSPPDKTVGYFVVSIVVALVVNAVISSVIFAVSATALVGAAVGAGGYTFNSPGQISGTVHLGGASVDLGQLDQAAKAAQVSAAAMQAQANGQPAPAGSVHALPADTLKALLPAALPSGFARTEVSAASAGAAGVAGSNAQGVYTKGDGRITLEVTDLAAMGALAAMGGAINVQSDRETATSYEKVGKVDGRLTTESFNSQAKTGKYSVVVANRFVVDAEGSGIAIDDLKAAVAAVGIDKLQGMAHA